MGFFDIRCQVSGISSYRRDLEGVLLVERDGRLAPLSVLVRGVSDRLGGIDMIQPAPLIDGSFLALAALIDEQRLTLDVPYDDLRSFAAYRKKNAFKDTDPTPIHGFEWLFSVLSYATWNATIALRLDGHPVRACLAVPRMIDAAVETVEARPGEDAGEGATTETLLDLAFDPRTTAREIHARVVADLADRRAARRALARLARLRAFLDERGGPRAPESKQDTEATQDEDAEAAFEALSQWPAFRRALAALYPRRLKERAAGLDRLDGAKGRGAARAYDPGATYRAGELIAHARFGEGVAVEDSREGRVEIDFSSGRRKLVCGRT